MKGILHLPKLPFPSINVSRSIAIGVFIGNRLFVRSFFVTGRNKEHFMDLPPMSAMSYGQRPELLK